MQKYLVQDNLDLLYSKLSEDSREILIQLDKDLKETENDGINITNLTPIQVRMFCKILSLQGYICFKGKTSLEVVLY